MAEMLVDEQAIFELARKLDSPASRQACVERMCGDDADMKQRVAALLQAHDQNQSFLESPPPGLEVALSGIGGSPAVDWPIIEHPDMTIGPYKLLEQIGEGGMGVVFMAEQTRPIQRTVALKIIKPGMDTREVVGRFEAERQALALMDHANIAKVYDAGATENGRPYFVMELVHGVPITDYCDECQLSTRQRLELFITVCQAVQHAHQKGVIHRDLKPNNLLVAIQDGRAAPKIIDFGVAKALNQRLTEHTLVTSFAQMIGTPLYMSPEQAELSPMGADTRSDVYSLGVLLYELLTGATPFDKDRLHTAGYDELRRILREEEPPRPSARLSTLAADLATTIAERRRTEPHRLAHQVHGELDWIVMKCLEKDRNRRYETATALVSDIERYLHDEPVEACPPSAAYRVRKFVRRNKATLAAAAIVAVSLVLGTLISIRQATLAGQAEQLAETRLAAEQQARRRATVEAAKATAISDLLQQMLDSANPDASRGSAYTVRQMLDDFSTRLGDQLHDQPESEAAIRATIGRAYQRMGALDKAEPHLAAAIELRERAFGHDHAEVAKSVLDYARLKSEQGVAEKAMTSAKEALAILRRLKSPERADHQSARRDSASIMGHWPSGPTAARC